MSKVGGKREGAGRKPKAQELALIEMMDDILSSTEAWEAVAQNVIKGDPAAQKLWISYRFGIPKQSVELTGKDGKDFTLKIGYGSKDETD